MSAYNIVIIAVRDFHATDKITQRNRRLNLTFYSQSITKLIV